MARTKQTLRKKSGSGNKGNRYATMAARSNSEARAMEAIRKERQEAKDDAVDSDDGNPYGFQVCCRFTSL